VSDAVALSEAEREVAVAEAEAVLARATGPFRADLEELIADVGAGSVEGRSADALQQVLELGLQSGRVRGLYGPAGEQAALKVYRRLPNGRAAAASAREVTEALSALHGAPLDRVSVEASGPGSFVLRISADGRELDVRLDRNGARLGTVAL
jgi:hypothetical protein